MGKKLCDLVFLWFESYPESSGNGGNMEFFLMWNDKKDQRRKPEHSIGKASVLDCVIAGGHVRLKISLGCILF